MATSSSMASLSRRLTRTFLSTPKHSNLSMTFSTNLPSPEDSDSPAPANDSEFDSPAPPSSSLDSNQQRRFADWPLENGLDVGIYKAILVGKVGQIPLKKTLRSGRTVTMFSVGTGGIRNNRRPFDNEEPKEYANRCAVQWHRVCVYPDRLGGIVMKHVVPGSTLYLEGNLETKVFSDPTTGIVRRVREIAIRQNGRLVFLGKDGDSQQATQAGIKGVGYY